MVGPVQRRYQDRHGDREYDLSLAWAMRLFGCRIMQRTQISASTLSSNFSSACRPSVVGFKFGILLTDFDGKARRHVSLHPFVHVALWACP